MEINYIDKLQQCDIIFIYNKKSWLHRLICYFTGKKPFKVGHVAMYMYGDMIIEANMQGVHIKTLKKYDDSTERLYLGRYEALTPEQKLKIFNACNSYNNEEYSYFQLIIMMLGYIFKWNNTPDADKQAVVCSELVADLFLSASVNLCYDKEPWQISPHDLVDSPLLKIINI